MTSDTVIRIFMPVIDAPTHLQLHASLDRRSFTLGDPELSSNEYGDEANHELLAASTMPIFWLDRATFLSGHLHQHEPHSNPEVEEGRRRKLKEFMDDDWELFAHITKDGSLIVRALTVGDSPQIAVTVHADTRLESG